MRSVRLFCTLAVLVLLLAETASAQTFSEQGNCSGASASASISTFSYNCYQEEVTAGGTWSSNAGAIYIKYYVDNILYQTETRFGSSGTWYFLDDISLSQTTHTLRIDFYPVDTSGGSNTTCLQDGGSDSDSISVGVCPLIATITDCIWNQDPVKAICYPDCTGTASGGTPPYSYTWCVDEGGVLDCEPTTGPTYSTTNDSPSGMSCRCGYAGIWDTVVFEVEDDDSSVDTDSILCGGDQM